MEESTRLWMDLFLFMKTLQQTMLNKMAEYEDSEVIRIFCSRTITLTTNYVNGFQEMLEEIRQLEDKS